MFCTASATAMPLTPRPVISGVISIANTDLSAVMTIRIHSNTLAPTPIAVIIAMLARSLLAVRRSMYSFTQNVTAAPPQSAACQSSTSFAPGCR